MKEICKGCPIKNTCTDLNHFMNVVFLDLIFKPGDPDVLAEFSRIYQSIPQYEKVTIDTRNDISNCEIDNPENCIAAVDFLSVVRGMHFVLQTAGLVEIKSSDN